MKRLLLLASLLATAAIPAAAQDKTKVCFIYVGSVGDFGWTYQHDQGRKAVEAHFGDKVETAYLENVPEGGDAERAIERFARSGCNIVFTTSFGFMDATNKVASRFPDVKFEHATGYKREFPNVTTYNSKFHEGRYIIGQIAAGVSKSGQAGYIASFPIPEVVMGINAFYEGAKSVNPDFELKIIWVNSWFDPGREADAANALIDQGVDVLTQHTDSAAPTQVAEERGVHSFGQASDQAAFGPTAQLTAIVDDWAPYYIERVQAVIDGTWTTQDTWHGLKEGNVAMAEYKNMPDEVAAKARETEAAIKAGTLNPFTGPINKQDGTAWLAAGQTAPDGDLLGMNFYVEGVEGSLPQ